MELSPSGTRTGTPGADGATNDAGTSPDRPGAGRARADRKHGPSTTAPDDSGAPVGADDPEGAGWLRRLLGYCWRSRRAVLLAFGASLLGMAVTALVPLVTKLIIDDVITAHSRPLAPWAVVLLLAAAVVFGCTQVPVSYTHL